MGNKKVTGFIFILLISTIFAQSTGDIAFIGWNSDGNDDIAFLTFIDISEGTKIYFRDDEYTSTWNTGEGAISWAAPSGGISQGTVIQIYDCELSPPTTSSGSVVVEDNGLDISNSEDAFYAYLSTDGWNSGTYTFLAAFCNATSFGPYLTGTGLTEDTDAWAWGNKDNWKYTGPTSSSSVSEMKTNLQNSSNWGNSDGSEDQSFTFSLSDFSLPVELTSFTATLRSGKVVLHWITESEIDNLGFLLERRAKSAEHGAWETVTDYKTNRALAGQGSVTHRTEYKYTDEKIRVGQTYAYLLVDVDYNGVETRHDPVSVTVRTRGITMKSAFPNPFNPVTKFTVIVGDPQHLSINVYDITGRLVKTLANEHVTIGEHIIAWDGTNSSNQTAASGIYFIHLVANGATNIQKVVLTR